jgi:hypothetical protein
MRIYSRDDEERIRAQGRVRAWARAKLLDSAQARTLEAELRVELRRTNALLRAGLALFTALVVTASVLLIGVVLEVRSDIGRAATSAAGATACLAAAEYLVRARRLYRYGVEEALASFSALLTGICAVCVGLAVFGRHGNAAAIAGLAAGGAGALGIYRRFGYVYALVGAAACAVLIPFQFEVGDAAQRVMAFAIISVIFAVARARRLDDHFTLQAASLAGAYLVLNLHIWDLWEPFAPDAHVARLFYWMTYAAIWIIPVAGFRLGIRQRDRELVDVSLLLAIATLVTNKPYLGWPRHTWDPMLLGVVLMAGAVAVRRWLQAGADGARAGYTAVQILDDDKSAVALIGTASAAFRPQLPAPSVPDTADFRGGQSGGGGGGAGY